MPRRKTTGHAWINLPAARARLREIDRALGALEHERQLLKEILGGGLALTNGAAPSTGTGRRPGRPPGSTGPSMLDAIASVMAHGPAGKGWVVADLKDALAKSFPAKVAAQNASALISSALIQAMRAKKPRFVGNGGGPGKARRYKLAASVS